MDAPGLGIEASLAERGWAVLELQDPTVVTEVRDLLLGHLRIANPNLGSLGEYHCVVSEENHFDSLHDLAGFYWEFQLGRLIISHNLDVFKRLIGPDLHIQNHPYLRAVRPHQNADAAPLHRDTYYGASPFEVSVLVPFGDTDSHSSLRVISGSHIEPDTAYPFVQTVNPDVAIQSVKHRLGYPYAPRVLDPSLVSRAERVPLKLGQVLIFTLGLVHGGGTNVSSETRFSSDIRLANSLAPVAWSRGVRHDYYVPLCTSAVTQSARLLLESNAVANTATDTPTNASANPQAVE